MLTEPSFLLDPPQINPMDEDHYMFIDDSDLDDIADNHLLLDDSEPRAPHLMPPTIHLDHDAHSDLLLSLHAFHPHHPPAPPPSPQEPSLLETVFQQQQASYTRKRSSSAPTPFLPQPAAAITAVMPQIPESALPPSRHHTPPSNLCFAHAKTLDELLRTIASNPNSPSSPRVTKARGGPGGRAGFPTASHRAAPPTTTTSTSRIPVASSRLRPCSLRNRERRSSAGGGWGGSGGGRGHSNSNGTGLLAPPSSPSVSLSPSDVPPSPISSPGSGGLKRSMWLRRASTTQRTRQIAHAAGLVELLRRREVGGVSSEVEAVGHSGAVVESLISELKEMGL